MRRISLLWGFIQQVRLSWRIMRDPRVPIWIKSIPVLPIVYLISPLDFIPDVFLLIGQIDDLAIIYGSMKLMEWLVSNQVVTEHRHTLRQENEGKVIDMTDYTRQARMSRNEE